MAQNYNNHKRFHPTFHFFTVPLILLGVSLAVYNYSNTKNIESALLIFAFVLIAVVAAFARMYALKAQDRAARAEEKLRYYTLTGKTIPSTLRMSQILALRFASDEEFVELVNKTVNQNLSSTEIKKAINNWKGDYNRI
jgi:predicted permease